MFKSYNIGLSILYFSIAYHNTIHPLMYLDKNVIITSALAVGGSIAHHLIADSDPYSEFIACSKIVGLSMAAAVTYGILHDQIAARVCPQYFSEGSCKKIREKFEGPIGLRVKKILETTSSPALVGSIWGTVTSLPVGLFFGVPLTFTSRFGSGKRIGAEELLLPVSIGLASIAILSVYSGLDGYKWAQNTPNTGESSRKYLDLLRAAGNTEKSNFNKFVGVFHANESAFSTGLCVSFGLVGYPLIKQSPNA